MFRAASGNVRAGRAEARAQRTHRRRPKLLRAVAKCAHHGDNRCVDQQPLLNQRPAARGSVRAPFLPGAIVIVTLCNPREKFWGMILALAPEGLSLSGIELASFEDLAVMVKDGEPFTPAVVFFPMHRIERVELDLPDGSLPSLSQRFFAKTALQPSDLLAPSSVHRAEPLRERAFPSTQSPSGEESA
jgi:hypothetical protein